MKLLFSILLSLIILKSSAQNIEAGVQTGITSLSKVKCSGIGIFDVVKSGSYWTNGLYFRLEQKKYAFSASYSTYGYSDNNIGKKYPEWDAEPIEYVRISESLVKNIHQFQLFAERKLFSINKISVWAGINASFICAHDKLNSYTEQYGANDIYLGAIRDGYTSNAIFGNIGLKQSVHYNFYKHLTANFTAVQDYNIYNSFQSLPVYCFNFSAGLGYKF